MTDNKTCYCIVVQAKWLVDPYRWYVTMQIRGGIHGKNGKNGGDGGKILKNA